MKPDEPKQPSERESPASGGSRARKPYQKPAFVWERAFETMALSCGKINITQAQCKFNRKSS